jgi:hypothetical protein
MIGSKARDLLPYTQFVLLSYAIGVTFYATHDQALKIAG